MKPEAKAWTINNGEGYSPSNTYQTLCEADSPGFAVQGTPDCANIGHGASDGQVKNSEAFRYCAKIDRVRIPVSDGRYEAVVDEADWPLVNNNKWCIFKSGKNFYAQRAGGDLMHRVVAGCKAGDGTRVDHRDGNGLNNTRENIRIGTQSQNLANQRQRLGTKSGFKGVSTSGGKWRAEIGYKKKRIYIGSFATKEEAAAAYNAKALELFGPFARLNPLPCPTTQKAAA